MNHPGFVVLTRVLVMTWGTSTLAGALDGPAAQDPASPASPPAGAAAQAPVLPASVRKALEGNANGLAPLTIEWTQKYEAKGDRSEAMRRMGLGDRDPAVFFHPLRQYVSWQDGKLYSKTEQPMLGENNETLVQTYENSYDGKVLYGGTDNPVQAVLFKRFLEKAAKDEPTAAYLEARYFTAAGFHFPRMTEWSDPKIKVELLHQLDQGGSIESIETVAGPDGPLLRISIAAPNPERAAAQKIDVAAEQKELMESNETPERQRELLEGLRALKNLPSKVHTVFDLDPKLGHAVVRWESSYTPGNPTSRGVCSNFQQLPGRDVWLPMKCEVSMYQALLGPSKLYKECYMSEVFEASGADTSPLPADRFVLTYEKPGTYVRDATLPEAAKSKDGYVSYTIPARPQDLDDVVRRAQQGEVFSPVVPSLEDEGPGLSKTVIAVNVALLAAIVGYFAIRRFSAGKREAA